jgi:hypothetical protein
MMRAVWLRSLAAAIAICALAACIATADERAGAKASCHFEPSTHELSLRLGSELAPTLVRDGDEIKLTSLDSGFAPIPCSGPEATVTNTDSIVADITQGFGDFWLDLSGGPFAPGVSAEDDGSPEIEITVRAEKGDFVDFFLLGSRGSDRIHAGNLKRGNGVDLNPSPADSDVDVTFTVRADALIDGLLGDDRISATGGHGFTGPLKGALLSGPILEGGLGDDRLSGADFSDTFYGNKGHDQIRARGGGDSIYAADGTKDQIWCGPGHDDAKIDGRDGLHACEAKQRERKTGTRRPERRVPDASDLQRRVRNEVGIRRRAALTP